MTPGRSNIGVKRMGELDAKVLLAATKQKYSNEEEAQEKAVALCSFWEDRLRDPSWHPFKIVTVNGKETVRLLFIADDSIRVQRLR